MGKCSKIQHIVRLRQMLRQWRIRAMESCSLFPPAIDVPAGHVVVCVGSSSRRFVMKATHLNHPAFLSILRQAEEEYGFSQPGPLSLPCDESVFLQILRQISSTCAFRFAATYDLDYPVTGSCCCCRAGSNSSWRADAFPLLRGFAEKQVW
ncbi:auxin-induced protein X10A-like [Phalaenopsis equestris]|uniref:auxin-induced protein X10A-like n=1 Tax=Phalaenopsis equestris TaxID=78828 RepID=UPI0009E3B7BF|nr:auxin-induced protein X10A-like [Phalaenopsis equestris]